MKLYRIDLPDPKNVIGAVELLRHLYLKPHTRKRKQTERYKWDEYWIEVLDNVLEALKKKI